MALQSAMSSKVQPQNRCLQLHSRLTLALAFYIYMEITAEMFLTLISQQNSQQPKEFALKLF